MIPNEQPSGGQGKRAQRIGEALHGTAGCSMPGTHDRLEESKYFLLRMLATYHYPDEFRWNLHAFVQSINSFAQIGLMECQGSAELSAFKQNLFSLMSEKDWRNLLDMRNQAVHKEPLLGNASMFVGMYRNKKSKLAMRIPIPPHIPSWKALAKTRNEKKFVDPHRGDIGEECGLERIWQLPQFGSELSSVCADILARCGEVLRHSPGHREFKDFPGTFDCDSPRMMFEHEVFPEIIKAWDGAVLSSLTSKVDTDILLLPNDGSEVLHRISEGAEIHAWTSSPMVWNGLYSSILVYSIDDVEIRENTAGFYLRSDFVEKLTSRHAYEQVEN